MRKKTKNDKKVRIIVPDFPPSYDPSAKGLMEKLEHANKVVGKVIRYGEADNKRKSNAAKPSQKPKTDTHSRVTRNSGAIRAKGAK